MYELLKIGKLPQSLGEVDPQEYPSRQRTKERLKGSLRKLLIKKKKEFKGKCLSCCNKSKQESTNDQAPETFICQGFY